MEGWMMKKFWRKQLPAALLALLMMVSLVPAAGAEEGVTDPGSPTEHEHTYSGDWIQDGANGHYRVCDYEGCTVRQSDQHHFGGWIVSKPATCAEAGTQTRTCSDCNYVETASLPKLSHTYGPWQYENNNNHMRTCTSCSDVERDAHTHAASDKGTVTVEAKCTTGGRITYNCTDCNATYYEDTSPLGHIDSDRNGICDRAGCGASMGTICTVTFRTPSGSTVIPTQTVLAGQRPSAVSNPSSFTSNGITYTFRGWMQGTSSTYVYTNQTLVTPSSVAITGNTVFTALYTTNGYTVTFQSLTAYGGTTSSTQTVPLNGYPTNPTNPSNVTIGGRTYTFRGWTTSYTGGTWYIYANQYLVTPSMQRVTSNITYYAVYSYGSAATISYEVDPGRTTNFDADDFYDAYRRQTSSYLDYVVFDISRSTFNSFEGSLYVGNTVLTYDDLVDGYFYYDKNDARDDDEYALDDLSLRAASNADDDSITLDFKAYGTSRSDRTMDGTVKLTVGDAARDDTIVYRVVPGRTVDFDRGDFNDVFRRLYPGETVNYVRFDRPSTSAFSDGTLYSDYDSRNSVAFSRGDLEDGYFYYGTAYFGQDSYALNSLTFAAKNSFKDTIRLDFTAYGTNQTHQVEGTVEIRSTSASDAGDITYKVAPGQSVRLSRTDFQNFLRDEYSGADLDYVVFGRPDDANVFSFGTLYANYGASGQTSFSRSNLNTAAFYYTPADASGRNEYALDTLSFVATSNFRDAITLDFTAYGDRSNEYVDGTLVIQSTGATAATSNYTGSIRYNTTAGTNVQINANDIARFYRSAVGGQLQYVVLSGVPSTGGLYYNYYGASSYGSSVRTQITAATAAGQSYYLNPTAAAQYALTELTYVPSGSNYCVTIPFTAYGTTGTRVTGTILISVTRSTVAEVYGVTNRNTAVSFPASGFNSAVLSATGSSLYSIQLLQLPAAGVGTVYVGSGTATRANTTTQYTYASGANSISQLRFVPASAYTGSVEIPYVALNSSGTAIASGTFSLGVVNSRKTFSDVSSSAWCYKYVTELSDAGVIDGYSNGTFRPDSTISYGAALKLVMLAAGYPEQAPLNNSSSVFSGYLAKAQADGLITRSSVNLSAPITRLQVAQLAAGAMKLSTTNLSTVRPFTDTSDLYVQALNAAGIIEGYFSNGTYTYRPNNTLTRGQVSAIVWRMLNYEG